MGVQVKQEFIDIFKKSNSISTINGKSNFLTRITKLTKDQKKVHKLQEEKFTAESKTKLLKRELDELKDKISYIDSLQEANANNEKLSRLFQLGIIYANKTHK